MSVDGTNGAGRRTTGRDRAGLPDVGVIIDLYLTMLESGTIEVFRSALRTRGELLSAALVDVPGEE